MMYLDTIGLGKKVDPKKRNAPIVKVKLVAKTVAKPKVVARRPIAKTVAKPKVVARRPIAVVRKPKVPARRPIAKTVAKPKVVARRPIAKTVTKPKVATRRPNKNKGSISIIYPASNNEIETYPGESISNQEQDIVDEPVGVLTPVKQAAVSRTQENVTQPGSEEGFKNEPNQFTDSILPQGAAPKSNTMMYVGGAVVLAGIVYLATKKSK